MSNAGKGPRLWKKPAQAGRQAHWVVKDGSKRIATGCVAKSFEHRPPKEAEEFLANYIALKHAPERKLRDVDLIPIADVLAIYHADRRDGFEEEVQQRRFDSSINRLNDFFGLYMLGEMQESLTKKFVKKRGNQGGARRDLENLRAAINHHADQNLHHAVIKVKLPPRCATRPMARPERSCSAALGLLAAPRGADNSPRATQGEKVQTTKYTLRHLARFILIGLYTGTRAAAIAAASPRREHGRAFVDLNAGIFYRLQDR
ncbi:hypothetical protein ACQ5SK_26885 [Bradyrhizobium japonicum]